MNKILPEHWGLYLYSCIWRDRQAWPTPTHWYCAALSTLSVGQKQTWASIFLRFVPLNATFPALKGHKTSSMPKCWRTSKHNAQLWKQKTSNIESPVFTASSCGTRKTSQSPCLEQGHNAFYHATWYNFRENFKVKTLLRWKEIDQADHKLSFHPLSLCRGLSKRLYPQKRRGKRKGKINLQSQRRLCLMKKILQKRQLCASSLLDVILSINLAKRAWQIQLCWHSVFATPTADSLLLYSTLTGNKIVRDRCMPPWITVFTSKRLELICHVSSAVVTNRISPCITGDDKLVAIKLGFGRI